MGKTRGSWLKLAQSTGSHPIDDRARPVNRIFAQAAGTHVALPSIGGNREGARNKTFSWKTHRFLWRQCTVTVLSALLPRTILLDTEVPYTGCQYYVL